MPSIEQLNNMAELVYKSTFNGLLGHEAKAKVMELTIAATQAKALSDIAYLWGFNK